MAGVAEALQVLPVREQSPVALVVPDVVHLGGRRPQAPAGALPAEGLPQELPLPEIVSQICTAVIVLTTVYSGVEYFMKNADILAQAK